MSSQPVKAALPHPAPGSAVLPYTDAKLHGSRTDGTPPARKVAAAGQGRGRNGSAPTGSGNPPEPVRLAPVIELRPRQRVAAGTEDREAGMATAEYAIATLAAVAFAALLVAVLSSGDVRELLLSLIRGALSFG